MAEGVVLVSTDHDLRAAFAPSVGMVGYSLQHRGEELLGQRGGLAAYRERGSSFGIPLLYPWANRLAGRSYSVAGVRAELDPATSPVRFDPTGLPIHGLLAASPHWRTLQRTADDRAYLEAELDWTEHEELCAGFPFPHSLRVRAELERDTLTLVTTVAADAELPVPISFGWHPYLRLPGVPREEWRVELPVRKRALLDERGLPTGATEPAAEEPGPLGARTYDDLFLELAQPAVFALEGGGRRIEMAFGEGYPVAQVYAPADKDYICFEPMTAPTNALVSGYRLLLVPPGERLRAEFSIRVRPL
jgi:aldose 1-epimerase